MADIRQTLAALRAERNRAQRELTSLDQAIRALQKLAVRTPRPKRRVASKPRRRLSAAGRRRIAEAQRARWAKVRKQKALA